MVERDKQRNDQQQKPADEKERRAHPQKDDKKQAQQARSDTDPESVKDKGYIKRIEEKTEKH
ncbi:MAG: hypothetical protein ACJ788_02435 [Ktedonobacteraceae bacterium]